MKRSFAGSESEVGAEIEVHHLPPTDVLEHPSSQSSRRLSVSPLPRTGKAKNTRGHGNRAHTPLKLDTQSSLTSSMQSASSIQTPPPTSSSTARRREREMRDNKAPRTPDKVQEYGQSPTKGERGAPFSAFVDVSPQPFGGVSFSPDALGFTNTGPATAPAYTQNRLLWDTNQDGNAMNIDFSGEDPFSAAFAEGEGPSVDSLLMTPKQSTTRREMGNSFTHDDSMIGLSTNSQNQQTTFLSNVGLNVSPGRSFSGAVDPSLLFSSPGGPSNPAPLPLGMNHPVDDFLQPYAHQIHEARRERDDGSQRPAKRRKKPKDDSPAVKLALQTLKDETISSSDSRRSSSSRSVLEEDSNHAAFPPLPPSDLRSRPRMTSNLRHGRKQSTTDSRPQRKTSVRLTVTADGRAQTKTEYVGGSRGSSARSAASEESSEESSEEEPQKVTASFNQSFGISKLGLSQPKMARFSVDPKSHSQKSSYASTLGTTRRSSIQATTQRSRRSSTQKSLPALDRKRNLPFDQISSSATISELGSQSRGSDSGTDTIMDSEEDRGDAQHELKKILRTRSNRRNLASGRSSYRAPSAYTGYENISPTTITDPDIATPSTALSQRSQVGNLTRCVCQSHGNDGEAMILW